LLLALLEKKHLKWLMNGMANGQDLWTPYTMEQIQKQLCGLYSETTINRALEKLGESGFIKKAPVWALYKRVRYCLNIEALQRAVNSLLASGILK
jgi:predicted transcriptional regulator